MTSGSPDYQARHISSASDLEQIKLSVTDADTSTAFTQLVKSLLIYNNGPNPVHYAKDTTAATTDFPIPAKAWLGIDVPISEAHFICDTDETATVFVLGVF